MGILDCFSPEGVRFEKGRTITILVPDYPNQKRMATTIEGEFTVKKEGENLPLELLKEKQDED